MTVLDPSQPLPIYFQLKTLILEEIAEGRYGPGDRLPTEEEICRTHGISRTPVHRALTELAEEGVILRKRRSGTFVNPHWVPRESTEIRVVVTEQKRIGDVRRAAPSGLTLNVADVGYADLRRTLTRAVAEGLAPDLAIVDSVWISEFADAGFLLPLDDLDPEWISGDFNDDFLSPFVDSLRYRGHLYAVPEESNVAGLWCHLDALQSRDFEPPETWDELIAIARGLTSVSGRGPHPVIMPGGSRAGETTTYCLFAVLASNGVRLLDEGVGLDSAAAVDALRMLRSLVSEGLMSVDVVANEWDDAPRALAHGRAALSLGGSYEAGVIASEAGLDLNSIWDHFAFVPFPGGPRGEPATVTGGMAYGIFRQSARPEMTMRVLKHIASTEALAQRSMNEPTIPPRRSTVEMIAPHSPFVARTSELFTTAVNRPVTRAYHLVSAQLQSMLEGVLTGRHGPAAAAEL
ncbi:MAG: extracellular solute-binding protein [Acidimicrobiia bacterium]